MVTLTLTQEVRVSITFFTETFSLNSVELLTTNTTLIILKWLPYYICQLFISIWKRLSSSVVVFANMQIFIIILRNFFLQHEFMLGPISVGRCDLFVLLLFSEKSGVKRFKVLSFLLKGHKSITSGTPRNSVPSNCGQQLVTKSNQ